MNVFLKTIGEDDRLPYGWEKVLAWRNSVVRDSTATGVELAILWAYFKTVSVKSQWGILAVNYREGKGDDDEIRFLLGKHPNLLVETMVDIVDSAVDGNSLFGLASNPKCDSSVLFRLRHWKGNDVIPGAVVDNPYTPKRIVEAGNQDSYYVKGKVAANRLTSKKILLRLAKDSHWGVRGSVATNPNIPAKAIAILAKDPEDRVVWNLVFNPSIPADVATKCFLKVQYSFSYEDQHNIPTRVLVRLLMDAYPDVHEGMPREWLVNLMETLGDDEKV